MRINHRLKWASYQRRKIAAGLCMHRECRERFPRHRLLRKPLCMEQCMSRSLSRCGGENVLGIPGACATRNCVDLVRCPWPSNMPSSGIRTVYFSRILRRHLKKLPDCFDICLTTVLLLSLWWSYFDSDANVIH